VELIITMVVMGTVMGGLANIFISGQRASADATARVTSQQSVRVAFDRLEYDARCASTATRLSSGVGVHLTLPAQCAHASGDVTWCVNSGALVRNAGTTCAATSHAITYFTGVTSTAPFSCSSPSGSLYPQLGVSLAVNTTTRSSNKSTANDSITMHNVLATYNSGSATALPATTITVGSTAGFPSSGTLNTPNGVITYTGTTSTTFTGATGGTGTLAVLAPVVSAGGCS
jgi:Tfp pilus assembly protein PilW